jgi:hypothetical protein
MAHTPILPEVWCIIGTYLPPQHLYKLLCTSKQINTILDNHDYWTLVSAQLIWRDCSSMEIHLSGTCEFNALSRVDVDLYNILGSDGDYCWLMKRFLARMDEMSDVYSKGAQQMIENNIPFCFFGNNQYCPNWWRFVFAQPLHIRNIIFYRLSAWKHGIQIMNDESRIPQKELVRRLVVALVSEKHSIQRVGENTCGYI